MLEWFSDYASSSKITLGELWPMTKQPRGRVAMRVSYLDLTVKVPETLASTSTVQEASGVQSAVHRGLPY